MGAARGAGGHRTGGTVRAACAALGSAAFLRRFHALATAAWAAMVVPGVLWWRDSVPFLVMVSIYANVVGHWSSWQASRAEEAVTADGAAAGGG